MTEGTVPIESTRLLWRTRGYRWDYTFLQRPTIVDLGGWLQLFEHVFLSSDGGSPPNRRGRILIRGSYGELKTLYYVAAAPMDPTRSDFAGRPVQHFFLYLLPAEKDGERFTAGWEGRLLTALAPVSNTVFSIERGPEEASSDFSERLQRELRTALPSHLELDSQGASGQWERREDFVVEKKTLAPNPTERKIPGWVWALALMLLAWLLWRSCQSHEPKQAMSLVLGSCYEMRSLPATPSWSS